MGDLDARRLVRELFRSGLDRSEVLKSIMAELRQAGDHDATTSLIRAAVESGQDAVVVRLDHGVEPVTGRSAEPAWAGYQHDRLAYRGPSQILHVVTIHWRELPPPVAVGPLKVGEDTSDKHVVADPDVEDDYLDRIDDYYDALGED